MTKAILLGCVILTTAALVVGFAIESQWSLAIGSLAGGVVWAVLAFLGRDFPAISLTLSVCLAVLAGWLGNAPVLPVVAVVAALSAWDLSLFGKRLRYAAQGGIKGVLERRHLMRLLAVNGIGFAIALSAILLRVRFSFTTVFFAGLALFFVLYKAITLLAVRDKRP
jgi:hypothetical protein